VAPTSWLRGACPEPAVDDADAGVQLAGDLFGRETGGAQALGLLDAAAIVADATASAVKFRIRPLPRAAPAGNLKGGAALGAFDEAFEQVDRQRELQPQRTEQVQRLQTQLQARLVLPKEQSRIDVLAQMRIGLPLDRRERGHCRIIVGNVEYSLHRERQFAPDQSRFQFGAQPTPARAYGIPERNRETQGSNLVLPELQRLRMHQRPTELCVNCQIRTFGKQAELVGEAEDLGLARLQLYELTKESGTRGRRLCAVDSLERPDWNGVFDQYQTQQPEWTAREPPIS
jgi:hypothetical protein